MDEKYDISRRAQAELDARIKTAVDGHVATCSELEQRQEPAAPGDLYVVAECAEQPVEWLVVKPEPGDRVLVIPADTQTLVGSTDVAVAEHEPGGPLALRCGHGVGIDAGLLDPEMRTGSLADEALARVRRRLAGELETSTDQVETDSDPEYLLWIEDVVEPARVTLEQASRPRLKLIQGAGEGKPADPRTTTATAPWWRGLAQAAGVVLAAGLVWLLLGTPGWRQDPEIATLTLAMSTRTGGEPTLTLAPDTETVELRVDLEGDDDYRSVRARLTTLQGVEVWREAGLEIHTRDWGSEVIVSLPAESLPVGDYELALEGIRGRRYSERESAFTASKSPHRNLPRPGPLSVLRAVAACRDSRSTTLDPLRSMRPRSLPVSQSKGCLFLRQAFSFSPSSVPPFPGAGLGQAPAIYSDGLALFFGWRDQPCHVFGHTRRPGSTVDGAAGPICGRPRLAVDYEVQALVSPDSKPSAKSSPPSTRTVPSTSWPWSLPKDGGGFWEKSIQDAAVPV